MILGDCYEAAAHLIVDRKFAGHPLEGWSLVHGIVHCTHGEVEGRLMGHAWVEEERELDFGPHRDKFDIGPDKLTVTLCHDYSNGNHGRVVPRELYYHVGRIVFTKHYDVTEACKMMLEYETYGGWEIPETFQGRPVLHSEDI